MNSAIFFILLLTGIIPVACNGDEKFSEEMCKKVFCLIGDQDNVYAAAHSFENEVSDGFVSIYCGGTSPVDVDTPTGLVDNKAGLPLINKFRYGTIGRPIIRIFFTDDGDFKCRAIK